MHLAVSSFRTDRVSGILDRGTGIGYDTRGKGGFKGKFLAMSCPLSTSVQNEMKNHVKCYCVVHSAPPREVTGWITQEGVCAFGVEWTLL